MGKKIFASFLVAVLIIATVLAASFSTSAEEIQLSGTIIRGDTGAVCTDALNDNDNGSYVDINWEDGTGSPSWSIKDGVLYIMGTGSMTDKSSTDYPWYSYRDQITKVVIGGGITHVGKQLLCGTSNNRYTKLEEIVVGEGVTSIGGDAFAYISSLNTLTLPSTLTTLSQGTVFGSGNIRKIYVAPGWSISKLTSVGGYNDNITNNGNITELDYTPITIGPAFGAWENWGGSPNVGGSYNTVTQLLVSITDADGGRFSQSISKSLDWRITISKGDASKTISLPYTTEVNAYDLYRFETVLGEGDNQFIPQKGQKYTVQIDIYDGDTLKYRSNVSSDFMCSMDPVVPARTEVSPFIQHSSCYVEMDLGSSLPISRVWMANYVDGTRYYRWDVYASDDNTLPLYQWTRIGAKTDNSVSTASGYTANMVLNAENEYDAYRYVRVYGTYDSANGGYHFSEMKVWSYSAAESYPVTWIAGESTSTSLVGDGEAPVYTGGYPTLASTYDTAYTFAGWTDGTNDYGPDETLPPVTGPITYTAKYTETVKEPVVLTVGSFNNIGMENWSGQTQLLYKMTSSDPTLDLTRISKAVEANKRAPYKFVFTFNWTDEEGTHSEQRTILPGSQPFIFAGTAQELQMRFEICAGDYQYFDPVKGQKYYIDVDIYDMSAEYGTEGFHVATSNNDYYTYALNAEPITYAHYEITWTLDGEAYEVDHVKEGVVPALQNSLPLYKTVNGEEFILVTSPTPVAAAADATYAMEYKSTREVTVTWKNPDGTVNYQTTVISGNVPEYKGDAQNYTEGYYFYEVVIPGIGQMVTDDTEYIISYIQYDTREITLGSWNSSWENWPDDTPNTQLLVTVVGYDGNGLNLIAVKDQYDWVLTINGKTYTIAPSTVYSVKEYTLYRFETCLADGENQFIPESGKSYTVGLTIYKKGTEEIAYQGVNTIKTTMPANIAPLVPHALIGANKYYTLEAAVKAAANGATITLCADIELANAVIIDKNITLDLNGYTISSSEDALKITADVTVIGNGKIVAEGKTVTVDGGTVAISGGTYSDDVMDFTAEGYITGKNADGSYTVVAGTRAETDATCTADGYYTYTYTNGEYEDYTVPSGKTATGHTEEVIPGKAATCTEAGLTEGKKCSVCGEVIVAQEEIPATGHTYSQLKVTAATCTEDGWFTIHCGKCDRTFDSRFDVEETTQYRNSLAPFITIDIEAKGHTEEIIPGKAATCTEAGLTEGKKCSVCGEVIVAQEEIPAVGHEYESTITKEPTYDEEGEEVLTCKNCGDEQIKVLPKLDRGDIADINGDGRVDVADVTALLNYLAGNGTVAEGANPDLNVDGKVNISDVTVLLNYLSTMEHEHAVVIDAGIDATCTETGLTEGSHCSVCGKVLKAQEVIPAIGHTEVVDEAVAPTCIEAGKTEGKHCSVCGEVIVAQEEIPAIGHTEEVISGKAATCTEAGLTEGKKCSVCGEIITAQEEIPATGHNLVNGACTECDYKESTASTATMQYSGGTTTNMVEEENAEKVGLDPAVFSVSATKGGNSNLPGLNKAGNIRLYASNGNGNTITVTAADGWKITAIKVTLLTSANGQLTLTAGADVESATSGVVELSGIGVTSFTLQNTNTTNAQVHIGTVEITYEAAEGACTHQWNDGEVTVEATCGAEGTVTYTCTLCGNTKTETIPATGDHANVETLPGKAATCTETGLTEGKKCTDCCKVIEAQEVIPAKGHNIVDGACTECDYTEGGEGTEEKVVKTLDFSTKPFDSKVSSYTAEWTATQDGDTWTIANFNNNNGGWGYVKAGRKGNASVATIESPELTVALTKVVVTVDAVTAANINSITLTVKDADGNVVETVSADQIAKGDLTFELTESTVGCTFTITFDCASGSGNGLIQISKIDCYAMQ